MNGLSLFTGIGGIDVALSEYVKPIAYCEIEPYCQSVLLQRMQEGDLSKAPIWDDIRTLQGRELPNIDIIYGGFPCTDISCAGLGEGLAGKQSGLFFEIVRLAKEIKPKFLFLENVPAITTRGGLRVVREVASLGYDCRWCVISAASVGALHRRERWFMLCNANSISGKQADFSSCPFGCERKTRGDNTTIYRPFKSRADWQEAVSSICRTSDGVQNRVDRLRALGNAVVPQQVIWAFKFLAGTI